MDNLRMQLAGLWFCLPFFTFVNKNSEGLWVYSVIICAWFLSHTGAYSFFLGIWCRDIFVANMVYNSFLTVASVCPCFFIELDDLKDYGASSFLVAWLLVKWLEWIKICMKKPHLPNRLLKWIEFEMFFPPLNLSNTGFGFLETVMVTMYGVHSSCSLRAQIGIYVFLVYVIWKSK